MMASAVNLFNLDDIAEHHETDSGHSSDVDEQEDDVFSTKESGELNYKYIIFQAIVN